MKKSTKILIWIFSLVSLFLAVSIGIIIKNRYYKEIIQEEIPKENPTYQDKKNEDVAITPTDIPGEFLSPEDKKEDTDEEKDLEEDTLENNIEKESHLEINKADCKNKCVDFKKEETDFRYCQEICGLIEIKKESSADDCEDMEGLEMDYCLRDLAISKKDYKICEKIEDKNISLNCQNRITEDILEEQHK